MSLFVMVVLGVAFLAVLGRSSTPRYERIPVLSWGFRDLFGNVAIGVRTFVTLSARHADRVQRARDVRD